MKSERKNTYSKISNNSQILVSGTPRYVDGPADRVTTKKANFLVFYKLPITLQRATALSFAERTASGSEPGQVP